MKINFFKFKKEKNFRKKKSYFNMSLYWQLAILSELLIIIFVSFVGYRLFLEANKDPVLPVLSTGTKIPTVNENRMTNTLQYFSEREKQSIIIINSPALIVDPSL